MSGCDADHYKNAVTGDYDLFAVWPKKGTDHAKSGSITRISERDSKRFAVVQNEVYIDIIPSYAELEDKDSGMDEDPRLGNVTNNVMLVGGTLNSFAMYTAGSVVDPNKAFHSDEGGRPGMDTVDLPTAVFVPCEGSNSGSGKLSTRPLASYQREMIKTKAQFLEIIKELKKDYLIQLQLGWVYDLLTSAKTDNAVYALVKDVLALDARKTGADTAIEGLKACVNGGRDPKKESQVNVVSQTKRYLQQLA